MITRENILELESRRRIYHFILKNLGLHLRALSRKINISEISTTELIWDFFKQHPTE